MTRCPYCATPRDPGELDDCCPGAQLAALTRLIRELALVTWAYGNLTAKQLRQGEGNDLSLRKLNLWAEIRNLIGDE